jgi:hypothetical protein
MQQKFYALDVLGEAKIRRVGVSSWGHALTLCELLRQNPATPFILASTFTLVERELEPAVGTQLTRYFTMCAFAGKTEAIKLP